MWRHPPVNPSFGYRFDFSNWSVACSGDTVPLDAVAETGKGADILVHEVMNIDATKKLARSTARDFTGEVRVGCDLMLL